MNIKIKHFWTSKLNTAGWRAGGGHPRAAGWAGGGVPILTGGTRGNPSIFCWGEWEEGSQGRGYVYILMAQFMLYSRDNTVKQSPSNLKNKLLSCDTLQAWAHFPGLTAIVYFSRIHLIKENVNSQRSNSPFKEHSIWHIKGLRRYHTICTHQPPIWIKSGRRHQ